MRRRPRAPVRAGARSTSSAIPGRAAADDVVDELRCLAEGGDDGPSLSAHLEPAGTLAQARELAIHRSAYQLKEADPHTWGIPRLTGRAKAGHASRSSAASTATATRTRCTPRCSPAPCRRSGSTPATARYLDECRRISLSTCNLISLFGLHRRWRGALVGHLALFEMCSVGADGPLPARRSSASASTRPATRFYAAHVVADEHHQVVALRDMVAPARRGRAVPQRRGRVRGPGPAGGGVAVRRARARRVGAGRDAPSGLRASDPAAAGTPGSHGSPRLDRIHQLRPRERAREGVHRRRATTTSTSTSSRRARAPASGTSRVSEKTGKQVDADDIEMGYEVRKGRYVTFDKDELADLRPESTRAIEVTDFVALEDIDPIYYERTYWLGPDGDPAKQAYQLLLAAMEDREPVGIGTVVMRNKQYLAAIRPLDGALAMSTMRFADEVVPASDIDGLPDPADQARGQGAEAGHPDRRLAGERLEARAVPRHLHRGAASGIIAKKDKGKATSSRSRHDRAEGRRRST